MKKTRRTRVPACFTVGIFLILGISVCLIKTGDVQAAIADHVVVNEVQTGDTTANGGAEYDWVELFNPTSADVNLDSWSIQRTTATGGTVNNEALSGIISAGGYLLIVRDGASTAQSLKDMSDVLVGDSFSIASNNVIYLINESSTVIDYVGMGSAESYEGTSTAPNPASTNSISRVPEGEDTDENSIDFISLSTPTPQNSGTDDSGLEGTVLLTITPNAEVVQNISPTEADIVFQVNTDGTALINYGLDDTYDNATPGEAFLENTDKTISISGLECGTVYHYSIYAENISATDSDSTSDATFETLPCGIVIDSLVMTKTSARANNDYIDGWEWEFNITVWDMTETLLKMKFEAWTGGGVLSAGTNMQFSVDSGVTWSDITDDDAYSVVGENISGIDNSTDAGRQVEILVRMKVPVGTSAGFYNSSYGILTE